MKNIKFLFKTMLLCLSLTLIGYSPVFADDPDGFDDPPPDDLPVDGGLSLFIAAGVGYGIKKAKDYRKHQKEMQEAATETEK